MGVIVRVLLGALLGIGVGVMPAAATLGNQLKNHPSPYLAMHGGDPVAWQDWGPQVLAQAKREGKLAFVSIGYFACHWCHVMQRESYQNAEIAAFINRHYIPVKVDRELEPALDARMITFAEATRGAGGWPLNVFLTPEGHPLFAVLYEPPQEFLGSIQRLQQLWTEDRDTLQKLARAEAVKGTGPGKPLIDAAQARAYARKVNVGALSLADNIHGGFGEQSKFPSVPPLEYLLAQYARAPEPRLKEFLVLTLDQMANAGLHDHLGGGFFRYTVDPSWKTPHFEKMLYDNALLARLYLGAARAFAKPEYEAVARRTLAFMQTELRDPSGALIASLSAVDDKGIEGGYYLWDMMQLAAVLSDDERAVFAAAWKMSDAPPFESGYLPLRHMPTAELAQRLGRSAQDVERLLADGARKLLAARGRRNLPRDTKLLAAWNGLALSAYAQAARTLNDGSYRATAQGLRDYLAKTLWDGKALRRAVHDGRAVGAAGLEDYAYVARGFLDFAQLTGQPEDYALASMVVQVAWKSFYDKDGWRLGQSVIANEPGQDIVADGPMPSPSAELIETTLRLAAHAKDTRLRERALAALNSGHALLKDDPFWYATHVGVMVASLAPVR
jgi:uncharacterized protein YyaL (SSP411 family)